MAGVKGRSGVGGGSKKAPKRTPEALKLDRAETVQLLRRGWTKTAIAEKLGVHQTQISYDWKCILKEVMEARDKDLEELIAIKLEEYGEIKREAWAAWEQSKKDRQRLMNEATTNHFGESNKQSETIERGNWSSEYLRTIINCLAAERELQGLNPAKQFEGKLTATTTSVNWDKLASAIPPPGVPLPDSVEDKIMALLEETGANEPVRLTPKQITYIPASADVPKSTAVPTIPEDRRRE